MEISVDASRNPTPIEAIVLLISAVASGQGKTTVTATLARKLVQQGRRVRVFKTGPDFLDPMLLQRASGAPVHTLDLWIVGLEQCRRQLAQAAAEADVILIDPSISRFRKPFWCFISFQREREHGLTLTRQACQVRASNQHFPGG